MKLQPLYDLQQDINRLFIAGSKFAQGDPRLQKHIPVLNKLGEKAPVFKKLATDIEELLCIDTQQSADKLMAISTLLYSILYTQGELVEADVEEKIQEPNIDIKHVNTEYSYLQLRPVIEALTVSNSGRLEILKDAFERNVFNDSRTYQYLDVALGDKYSELSDYVEKIIIPKIGTQMLPFLLQNFRYEDKTENARRLRLLYKLEYSGISELMDKILSESLPVLQAEVVKILSHDSQNEELIIKLADDKNKLVREAAYIALANLNTRTSLEKLKDIFLKNKNKPNLPSIVTALASSKLPFFFQEVFNQVSIAFQEFIALDKTAEDKVLVDKLDKFKTVLDIFENKVNDQVFDFFSQVLQNKQYNDLTSAKKNLLENITYAVAHSIIGSLNTFSEEEALRFYEENMSKIPEANWKTPLWNNYFYKAVKSGYPKERVFDLFSELLKKKIINISNLYNVYTNDEHYYYYSDNDVEIYIDNMDSRWLDILYAHFSNKLKWNYECEQALRIIHACEPKKSERFDKLLIELVHKVQPSELVQIFRLIIERELPDSFGLIYAVMEKFPKNTYYYSLNRLKNKNFWTKFPKEYAAKFRELHTKTKLEIYSEIADEIENQ